MENNRNPAPNNAKTANFNINDVKRITDDSNRDPALAGSVRTQARHAKKVGAKTLKRRVGALLSSRLMLLFCVFISVSAVLTVFRGYFVPFTVYLSVQRFAMAGCAWWVYLTAGKQGTTAFSWLPVAESIAAAVMMLFLAAYTGAAMFKKALLFPVKDYVVDVYNAGMWAIVVGLSFIAIAYCIYLFERHQRLVLCNMRDAVQYGFSFSSGSKRFVLYGFIVAGVMPLSLIVLAIMGGFDGLPYISADAAEFMNRVYNTGWVFVLNLIGVLVHSAAIVVSTMIVGRFDGIVKRYKEQREMQKKAQQNVESDGVGASTVAATPVASPAFTTATDEEDF